MTVFLCMMSKHLNGRSVILSLSPSAEGPGTPRIHERKLLDLLCPSAVYTQRTGVSDMPPCPEELLIVEANHLKLCNLAAFYTHMFVFHPKGRVRETKSKVARKQRGKWVVALLSVQTLCVKCCGEPKRVVWPAWHET